MAGERGWQVVSQRGTEDLVNGRWTEIMIVTVQTADGTTKDFRIPQANYTTEGVAAIVDEWAERQKAIANL